jgi:hypothetical protein
VYGFAARWGIVVAVVGASLFSDAQPKEFNYPRLIFQPTAGNFDAVAVALRGGVTDNRI